MLLFATVALLQRARARLRMNDPVWVRHQDDRSFWRWYLSHPRGRVTSAEHVAAHDSIISRAGTSLHT